MPTWFIAPIKFQKADDSAAVDTRKDASEAPRMKTVTEVRLFDAVSYTDAEKRLYAYVSSDTPDFEHKLREYTVSDVFKVEGGDDWYRAEYFYMSEDDKGRSKKVNQSMLINASTWDQANERIKAQLDTYLISCTLVKLQLTPIIEVLAAGDVDLTVTGKDGNA